MSLKGVRTLLAVHGLITASAGTVLCIAPEAIPHSVGLQLESQSYLLAYLLAAAEFGFSFLSFGGIFLRDAQGIQLVVWSCVVLHGGSGLLESYALARGAPSLLLANVAARVIIVALFVYLVRMPPKDGRRCRLQTADPKRIANPS